MLEVQPIAILTQGAVFVLFGVIPWIITIVALVDAIRVPDDSRYRAGTKVVWVLVILFLNCLGALIYYTVGRPKATL